MKKELYGLIINIAEICNMKCTYCFAKEGTYDNTEKEVMQYEDLREIIDSLFEVYPNGTKGICFFGGEPLIAFEQIKCFVPYVLEKYKKRNLDKPIFSINTNGTLITNEVLDFFNKYHFTVTISIDGEQKYHDEYRILKNGNGTFQLIENNLAKLKKKEFFLLCETTLTKEYISNYKNNQIKYFLEYLYDMKFDNVAFFVVDGNQNEKEENEKKIKEIYRDIVNNTFQLLLTEQWSKAPTMIVSTIVTLIKKKTVSGCAAGKKTLFVNSNLEVYPCQMYYQAKLNKMGQVQHMKEVKEEIELFQPISHLDIDECKECVAYKVCSQWCAGSSILFSNKENGIIESRCIVQKAIVYECIQHLKIISENEIKRKVFVTNIKKYADKYNKKEFYKNNIL